MACKAAAHHIFRDQYSIQLENASAALNFYCHLRPIGLLFELTLIQNTLLREKQTLLGQRVKLDLYTHWELDQIERNIKFTSVKQTYTFCRMAQQK